MTDGRSAFIERAKKDAVALKGYDPNLPLDDLDPLADIVGRSRIVAVGESWHSTQQILGMKHRVMRFLIERMGFSAVVFEGSLPGSEKVDSFVLGGAGSAVDNLFAFGQPMWLNPETAALVEWLRDYNSRMIPARKIRVIGKDIVYPAAAIFALITYLERVDPDYPFPHRDVVEMVGQRLQAVPVSSTTKSSVWGSTEVFDRLSETEREQFRDTFTRVIAQLAQNRANYAAASSCTEFEWMTRYATVVLQSYGIISIRSRDLGAGNAVRDFAHAENVAWILDQLGRDAKLIVFSHNMHVSRDPFRSLPEGGPPIGSMGVHLDRWFAHDYVAIGSAVGRGRVTGGDAGLAAAPADEADPKTKLIASSVDAALEEVGLEHFLLKVPADMPWINEPHVYRSHLDPQPRYTLANAFDAVLYCDRITRVAPLERTK